MADQSSNKKPRFLPDPSKWIQTAPSSSSIKKPQPQRPLASFRNTFATPPTSVRRTEKPTAGPSQTKRQNQGTQGISGFFTPPTTTTSTVHRNRNNTPSRLPTTTTTTGKNSTLKKSRLYVRADDGDDSSPDSGDEVVDKRDSLLRNQDRNRDRDRPPPAKYDKPQPRAEIAPLQSHRSAPVTSSSSGMSDAIDQDQDVDERTPIRKRREHRTLTSSPSPSPSPVFPPGSPDHPISSHMSSDRPITPVPDYVLEIHRRLCGRDERIRRNRDESPLKPLVKKSRKEIEKEKVKHAIDERAHDQALVRRRRAKEKENEGGKRLVVGSSQTAEDMVISPKNHGKRKRGFSPVDMAPLAPVIVNTIRHGAPIKRETTHTDIPTARKRQAHSNAFSPSAVYEELCGRQSPSPPRKVVHTPPKSRSLRRIPTGNSPGSAIPLTSPSPIKPLTPPTSSTSAGSIPFPPDPDSGPRYAGREFKPVPMHAETLLSWSGGLTTMPRKTETTAGETPVRPDPRPIQHKHDDGQGALNKVDEKDSETQSLAPSLASQSFPNILPSPTRPVPSMFAHLDRTSAISTTAPINKELPATTKAQVIMPETIRRTTTLSRLSDAGSSRSIARFPTNLGVSETVLPDQTTKSTEVIKAKGTSNSPTTTPRLKSRSSSGWPAFGFDETTPTNPGHKRPLKSDTGSPNKSSSSTKKRKSSPTTVKPAGTQSKLVAFGFFGEKPKKAVRGFEEDWEMEDDLPFEIDLEPDARQQKDRKEDGSRPVPPPPPHPALRPAGLKELKKREEALAAFRPRFERLDDKDDDNDNDMEQLFPDVQASSSQTPGHIGSSTSASASSSFTTDDELTGIGSSAAAWWDGLEDRRSSEFGSFT